VLLGDGLGDVGAQGERGFLRAGHSRYVDGGGVADGHQAVTSLSVASSRSTVSCMVVLASGASSLPMPC
jgi:hypothetical protein